MRNSSHCCKGPRRVPSRRRLQPSCEPKHSGVPFAVSLRVLQLSPARHRTWANLDQDCPIDDRSSCPRTSPSQLTAKEISDIRDVVVSQDYRHMSIRSLALRAQWIGEVFVSPTTWAQLTFYPGKPKDGIGATRPNAYWHLEMTIIKFLDGTRMYLHTPIQHCVANARATVWNVLIRSWAKNEWDWPNIFSSAASGCLMKRGLSQPKLLSYITYVAP
jgi:hypothetical protein